MAILARPSGASRIAARGSLQHFRWPRPIARCMLNSLPIGTRARNRVQLRPSDSLLTTNPSFPLSIDNEHSSLHDSCAKRTSHHRPSQRSRSAAGRSIWLHIKLWRPPAASCCYAGCFCNTRFLRNSGAKSAPFGQQTVRSSGSR